MKIIDAIALTTITLALIFFMFGVLPNLFFLFESKKFISAISGTFSLTVIATLIAAFAGAYGAQLSAEKSKIEESTLSEIRNINAAIILAFSIFNSAVSQKKQHVLRLKENYYDTKMKVLAAREAASRLPQQVHIRVEMDFRTLSTLTVPTKLLQEIAFNRISSTNRILAITTMLIQIEQSLNEVISIRNVLVKNFQQLKNPSDATTNAFYFGFPDEANRVDTSYPDTVDGIYNLCDDFIYYSYLLCDDLNSLGNERKEKFGKDIRITRVDFAASMALIPSKKSYQDFEAAFAKA